MEKSICHLEIIKIFSGPYGARTIMLDSKIQQYMPLLRQQCFAMETVIRFLLPQLLIFYV